MTVDLDKARGLLKSAASMPPGHASRESAVREATAWALLAIAEAEQVHIQHEMA